MPANPAHEPSLAAESIQAASMRAMGLLASGRNLLILLISLAILFEVGLFAAATWADVLRTRPAAASDSVMVPQEGAGPDAASPEPAQNFLQGLWPAETWRRIMEIGLPIAGVVAVACALALVPLTMLGVQVNLVGRLPALSATISAFYWSLITVVVMLPSGYLLGGVLAERWPWVFYTYKDIVAAGESTAQGQVWLRFLVWPVAALLASWICGARFGNAYWQVVGLAEMQAKSREAGNG